MEFNTRLLHGKSVGDYPFGATLPPIFQNSAFAYKSMEELEKVFSHKAMGFAYTRIGNPTVAAFEQRINELEEGLGALATASGMAAVTLSILNCLSSGDEILCASGLYGGTIELLSNLKPFGIEIKYLPVLTEEELEKNYTSRTKLVFAEIIGNPSLDVLDVKKVSDWAHSHKIPLFVDSTMAAGYLCKPLCLGADVVIHSSSKYINGSSDSISGVIVSGGKFIWDKEKYPVLSEYSKAGPMAYLLRLRSSLWASMGGCLSPFNAYMNIIGLETLGLRMKQICKNTEELSNALSSLSGIKVNALTLPENPNRQLVKEELKGLAGGVFTLRTGSKERALRIINSLKYAKILSNIGDLRTLVLHPASTLYIHDSVEEMHAAGVYEDTIRVSVGIEDAGDLIEDFLEAIKKSE